MRSKGLALGAVVAATAMVLSACGGSSSGSSAHDKVSTTVDGQEVSVITPTVGAVGTYTFDNLPTPGTYVVTFTAPGHGTATRIGDPIEREALAQVWGDGLGRLKVSSTKALHGHLLGAAGALEAVITVLALANRQLPPNAHCAEPDPACALSLVQPGAAEAPDLEAAVSSSFAFGGSNAVLLFQRA